MPLPFALMRGIFSFGFEKPSEIQSTAIVPIARGDDVLAQAPAGSGKTGAFVVGFLARMDFTHHAGSAAAAAAALPQVLALSPTRELAQQTFDTTCGIGQYVMPEHLHAPVQLLVAGTNWKDDQRNLNAPNGGGALVAAGTPGRVLQLLEKGALRPERLKTLVLDEADQMLSQGFQEQVAKILRFMPRDIQVVLVSATLADDVRELAGKLMRPERTTKILLAPQEVPVQSIRQFYVACDSQEEKFLVLTDLYERISVAQSIIFVSSRRKAEYLAAELTKQRYTVALTHGDLSRDERDRVMAAFRGGHARVLVSTDLIGRGIDVYHVNIVINYDMPLVLENYIHRVGRCGRFGRKGLAINLLAKEDVPVMRAVEAEYGVAPTELPANFESSL